MDYAQLLHYAAQCLNECCAEDVKLDHYIQACLDSIKEQEDRVFIKQILIGCVRYEEFIAIFLDAYGSKSPILEIMTYLTLFRLDEIS
jgi:hypothetical protein